MLGLAGNVLHQGLCLGLADRKTTIATLPGKSWDSLGFQPLRRAAFEDFDHLGYILGARELEESVHVVGGASDSDGRTLDSAKNPAEISVSGLEQVAFPEKRVPVLGRENEMYQQTGQGLWHFKQHKFYQLYTASPFLSRFQRWVAWGCFPRPRKLSLGSNLVTASRRNPTDT